VKLVHWRDAREPGAAREGARELTGLEQHLELIHHYALTRLSALTVVQLVLLHERPRHQHPRKEMSG
jgi:hypothetical protein